MGSKSQLAMSQKLSIYEEYLKGTPKRKLAEIARGLDDPALGGYEDEALRVHPQTINKAIAEFEELKRLLPEFPQTYLELVAADVSQDKKGDLFELFMLLKKWVETVSQLEIEDRDAANQNKIEIDKRWLDIKWSMIHQLEDKLGRINTAE